MNFKLIKKNILFLFLFLSFLILGILISSNYFLAKNLEKDILKQFSDHRDLLVEKAAINIESEIINKKLEINLLEKKIILNEILLNSCSNNSIFPKTNSNTYLGNYFIINKNGKIISCSDNNYLDFLNLNIGDTKYFKEVLNSKDTIIKHIKTTNIGQIYFLTKISNNKVNKYEATVLLSIIEISNLYSKYIHELTGNGNFYYLYDKTNSKIIMKSEELNITLINSLKKNSYKTSNKFVNLDLKKFIFNKKQIKVGDEIWELGILSSTKNIDDKFIILNNKHLVSIFFIIIILSILFVIIFKINHLKENAQNKLKKVELSLKKYQINFDPEISSSKSFSENKLENGNIYFIRDDFEQSYELFVRGISEKKIGLGFLKSDIDRFKSKYNLNKTSFINLGLDKKLNSKYETETNSNIIFNIIFDFITKTNKPKIILIDHLDYIILQNSFKEVLINLYELSEKIKDSNTILIFSLNQNVISNRELLALEKEFIDIETEEKKLMENISDLELQILIYINNSNNNKVEIRYKDISSKFNITKPTTSKKINQLQKNNLILIKDLGRRKIIEITQKGRKII